MCLAGSILQSLLHVLGGLLQTVLKRYELLIARPSFYIKIYRHTLGVRTATSRTLRHQQRIMGESSSLRVAHPYLAGGGYLG